MYKLNITLGFSIFELCYLPYNNRTQIFQKIEQHRIILSERLIRYYLEKATETNEFYVDLIETYIQSCIYTADKSVFYNTNEIDQGYIEELLYVASLNAMKVLIAEENEVCRSKARRINLITSQSIILEEFNAFYRYTLPICNHLVRREKTCDSYSTWFGHLFENEKYIEIQDRYLMSSHGCASLKKYYLSKIEDGADIDIYITGNIENEDEITREYGDSYYSKWNIQIFECESRHERYIQFSNIQIVIGSGLDFLDVSGRTRESFINISNSKVPIDKPRIIRQII